MKTAIITRMRLEIGCARPGSAVVVAPVILKFGGSVARLADMLFDT
ncbi:hypothetical protein [Caballeronia sp. AZ10_KS36]|nr:hypothetical protein [Caballeronia sp. AZ10_KS36]